MAELIDSVRLLYGIDVRNKFSRPTYSALRGDVHKHYDAIRKYAQTTSRSIFSFGWLLDIARCVYTLRTGRVIAKTAAGEWALENTVCPVPDALTKAVEVRRAPLAAKADEQILAYAEQLGGYIQLFADVLELEFENTAKLFAESELAQMGIDYSEIEQMQYKDGISLWRVDNNVVLKCFDKADDRREIQNYKILAALGIPTLKLINSTSQSVLIEDIKHSAYRLGVPSDLNDTAAAALIARWYKSLHNNGREYAQTHELFDECSIITLGNINIIKQSTDTADNPVWTVIENSFDEILTAIMKLPRTLTYNDFYYTNMAVAHDDKSALMYDYNLLGKGYVYSDIRNVCSSLDADAVNAFLSEYGEFNKFEIIVDEVASALTALYFACEREQFPHWAQAYVERISSGELRIAVEKLVDSVLYISDPCGSLSTAFWKKNHFKTPDSIEIVREKDSFESTDGTRYFKLTHNLGIISDCELPSGYCFRNVQLPEDTGAVADFINRCYGYSFTADDVLHWTKYPVFDDKLWVFIRNERTQEPVALGVADFDKEIGEGSLEWIQVLPEMRGRGFGSLIVNELLSRLKGKAKFVTVSGECDNPTNPEKLYRKCRFVGDEIWRVVRKEGKAE
jgi:GNAT superfamily N-acetyltransferase